MVSCVTSPHILSPFWISGFRNFGDFWLFSSNFATTREVGTPMRCVRYCLKLSASFDIWWSCTSDEQIGCKSQSKMNFRSLAIEISRFWGAQIENWIGSGTKITMFFPNPLSHLCETLCPRSQQFPLAITVSKFPWFWPLSKSYSHFKMAKE